MLKIERKPQNPLMKTPLQQIQLLDISTLSTQQDFSNVLKQLAQIDNAEFVQQFWKKLAENPHFQRAQLESQEKNDNIKENSASARLAALVAEKRAEKKVEQAKTAREQAVRFGLNFANYQVMAAAFSEILSTQGAAVFVIAVEQRLAQIQVEFQQNPTVATQHFVDTALAAGKSIEQRGEPLPNKAAGELAARLTSTNHAARPHTTDKQQEMIEMAQLYAEVASLDPTLSKKLFKRDKNGEVVRNPDGSISFHKAPNVEQMMQIHRLLEQKYDESTPVGHAFLDKMQQSHPHNYKEVMESQKQRETALLARHAIANVATFYQTSLQSDKKLKIEQQFFNAILSNGVENTLKEPSEGVESLKTQLREIKAGIDESRFSPLQRQFEQFGLYYANAQRMMQEKNLTFDQFLMSKDGDRFGLARQLLNTGFVKEIAKLEQDAAVGLLKELGANQTQALIVLKAYQEINDNPAVFEHLAEKAKKDYGGLAKQAEYEISAEGITQKLDFNQRHSQQELLKNNPEWQKALEQLVEEQTTKEKKKEVEEDAVKNNQSALSEDIPANEQVNKLAEIKDYDKQVMIKVVKDGGEIQVNNNEYNAQKLAI